jgi:dolichol-phosphate mannosyltransferase
MIELAVVTPCFNERDNLVPLISAIDRALPGIEYEVIVVDDDSEDGTAEHGRELARQNPRVRVLHRIHRKGLSSAVVEGMMATSAPYIAVIDADMQHDESILPEMLRRLKADKLDIVIGSRNTGGGSMGGFSRQRKGLSNLGKAISRGVCGLETSDPMSGFFLLDRRFLDEVVRDLSQTGFKILVDLLASAKRPVQMAEVAYSFRSRERGESKLNFMVGLEFLQLILEKKVAGNWIPASYLIFGLVGAGALALNLLLLYALLWAGSTFSNAFLLATGLVITLNFALNDFLAPRSLRLRGFSLAAGFVAFAAGCGIGVWVALYIATALMAGGVPQMLAALIGVTLALLWNSGVSSLFKWKLIQRFRAKRRKLLPSSQASVQSSKQGQETSTPSAVGIREATR